MIEKVAYYAGIVSVPLLLIISYVRKACERLESDYSAQGTDCL